MITTSVTNTYKFVGLSTETKPKGPAVGSIFEETDTGDTFFYNGKRWVKLAEEESGGGAMVVHFSLGEGDTVTADKTYEEIVTAIEAGDYVYGVVGNDRLSLSSYIEDTEIWFSLAYDDNNVLDTETIVINADDTVPIVYNFAAYDLSSLIVE